MELVLEDPVVDGELRYVETDEAILALSACWRGRLVVRGTGLATTTGLLPGLSVITGEAGRSVYRYNKDDDGERLAVLRACIWAISSSEKPASVREVDQEGGRPERLYWGQIGTTRENNETAPFIYVHIVL